MALVSCRECGKEISSQAKVCPHCGVRRINVAARALIAVPFLILLYFLYPALGWWSHTEFIGFVIVLTLILVAVYYAPRLRK